MAEPSFSPALAPARRRQGDCSADSPPSAMKARVKVSRHTAVCRERIPRVQAFVLRFSSRNCSSLPDLVLE